MKDLQEIKFIAEQIFTLTRELMRLVDMDEQARQKFIKDLKKTCTEKLYLFPVRRRQNTTTILCKNRQLL